MIIRPSVGFVRKNKSGLYTGKVLGCCRSTAGADWKPTESSGHSKKVAYKIDKFWYSARWK